MIDVAQALKLVLEHAAPLPAGSLPAIDALGLTLAADVVSDIDSPPHDKAMVDGYAVIAADLSGGTAELAVIEEVAAGSTPTLSVRPGQATRIMTGAPLPEGADCVVMVERTELSDASAEAETVRIDDDSIRPGANILRRAYCLSQGQRVLERGHVIRGIEVGLLAEVGCQRVSVTPRPRVAMLSTGDELVDADTKPAAGQIRNSNSPMLLALARSAGAIAVDLGIARDKQAELETKIAAGLEFDVLLLSGGVSAGKYDYTPQVLAKLGVEQVFHKVALKPGKPLWFGVLRREAHSTLVFGLPGNPVSSFVCFELFVRPAIHRLMGIAEETTGSQSARLAKPYSYRTQRPIYHPARCYPQEGALAVEILPWKGSADMLTVTQANCLALLPVGENQWEVGQAIEVLRF
jgi:molybdopterin molybdotransferase